FLTRIPVPVTVDYSQRLMNQCSVYFPLVGLLLGGLYAGLYTLLAGFWSPQVCVLLVLGFHLWITGAFHEDGMADCADGLGGGYTVARRGRTPVQLTHDLLRQAPRFAAGLRQNRREISLTVDRSLIDTLVTPRRWRGDEISPFERCRVLDPAPQDRLLAAALRDVCHSFPALAGVPVRERWGGIIDVTPDGVPVIDQAPGISGLVIATGFSGHGFGLGPGAGQLAAELATGAAPLVDPAPFRLARLPGARRAAAAAGPLRKGA
ncbi:adenosylcobinamide-GDP ribazoletransferase, partial [Marinovum algicola]|uniref:adenosylcobinamide-GDP ribazoletransferase n=1 Tax=Marinovum algicola TaxID=42444 RepID=UPI0024BA787C